MISRECLHLAGHLKPVLSIRNITADAWIGISMAITELISI